jgi:hypothetical protein
MIPLKSGFKISWQLKGVDSRDPYDNIFRVKVKQEPMTCDIVKHETKKVIQEFLVIKRIISSDDIFYITELVNDFDKEVEESTSLEEAKYKIADIDKRIVEMRSKL